MFINFLIFMLRLASIKFRNQNPRLSLICLLLPFYSLLYLVLEDIMSHAKFSINCLNVIVRNPNDEKLVLVNVINRVNCKQARMAAPALSHTIAMWAGAGHCAASRSVIWLYVKEAQAGACDADADPRESSDGRDRLMLHRNNV